jgi:hypothetical protein
MYQNMLNGPKSEKCKKFCLIGINKMSFRRINQYGGPRHGIYLLGKAQLDFSSHGFMDLPAVIPFLQAMNSISCP